MSQAMPFVVECTAPSGDRREKEVESRSAAEEKKQELKDLGFTDIEIRAAGTEEPEPEVVDHQQVGEVADDVADEIPANPDIGTDPVDWMPSHFIDEIQGVPTLNRKGFAVMCERFDVSVTSEPVTLASDTEFEYAEFRATARTPDGTEYSGFGSAHVDRMEGDDRYLLNELAETRAMKRAAAWATGVGMTAASEMEGSL